VWDSDPPVGRLGSLVQLAKAETRLLNANHGSYRLLGVPSRTLRNCVLSHGFLETSFSLLVDLAVVMTL
jgi:hypothetical protein